MNTNTGLTFKTIAGEERVIKDFPNKFGLLMQLFPGEVKAASASIDDIVRGDGVGLALNEFRRYQTGFENLEGVERITNLDISFSWATNALEFVLYVATTHVIRGGNIAPDDRYLGMQKVHFNSNLKQSYPTYVKNETFISCDIVEVTYSPDVPENIISQTIVPHVIKINWDIPEASITNKNTSYTVPALYKFEKRYRDQ